MDDAGDAFGDQSRRDLSISNAASSMINASDVITAEAYQANLKRIQEVKEIVRKLEMNNEAAHKNFLVDQLEKRAKEGREAENMLVQLKNQTGISAVHLSNNAPSVQSQGMLPATATLEEIPESHPTPTHLLSSVAVQQPPTYNWGPPTQLQPFNPALRYYVPPSQHSSVPRVQTFVNQGQYMQNRPQQSRLHDPSAQTGLQPIHVNQQPPRSWNNYPSHSASFPATNHISSASISGGLADVSTGTTTSSPAEWSRKTSAQGIPVTLTPVQPMYPSMSQPSVMSYSQPANLSSHLQAPRVGVPVVAIPTPHMGSNLASGESRSRSASSRPVITSEPQRLNKPLQPPQLPAQVFQSQPQPRPPQPPSHSQQSLYTSQTHQRAPPPATTGSVPQRQGQPSKASHPQAAQVQPRPIVVQEQANRKGSQTPWDQPTFVKLFQGAVQRGALQLRAFWSQARASGVTDEWFKIAIDSLPRNVWQSVMAQANGLPAPVPQQQATAPGSTGPTVNVPSPVATAPLVQMTPSQQVTKPPVFYGGSITPGSNSEPYVAQVQYYAEQATMLAHNPQLASISKSSLGDIASTRKTPEATQGSVPQAETSARTPKDANKSTLARDILYALGSVVEKHQDQEPGRLPGDQTNDHEDHQPPVVVHSEPDTSSVVPSTTGPVEPNPPLNPSVRLETQDIPQVDVPSCPPTAKVGQADEQAGALEGPIMIDLTAEDSDEYIDGNGREQPVLQMESANSAAATSQPVSPTGTTNHTPLLENLSLEEQPVSGVSESVDVGMYSPPLSLAAEENMDSELLYPPPGNVEPVPAGFDLSQDEPTRRPLDDQLPLFLPSPPVSPPPNEPGRKMNDDEGESWSVLKRSSVEADKVETDTERMAPHGRKRQKQQVYVLVPPAPFYVRKAKMRERDIAESRESESEDIGGDEELQYSHHEQMMIEESKLRLSERRCRWLDCAAILNCATNMLAHLRNHAREEGSQAPFHCRWTSCQRQFRVEQERDVHMERHAARPLPCPYEGCDKEFEKPLEVMRHEVQHSKGELFAFKPSCRPVVPAIPARLGAPPQRLPSYRVIPRRVGKCQISADRHAIVGPWVLWNIFSPVELNTRKQNASMRNRPRQSAKCDVDGTDAGRDDYDFLTALSSYGCRDGGLDDLDSGLVTASAARGMTLWGEEERVDGVRL